MNLICEIPYYYRNYSVDEDSKWNTDDTDRTDFYGFNFYLIIFNPLLSEQFLYWALTQNCFNQCWSVKSVLSVCYFSLRLSSYLFLMLMVISFKRLQQKQLLFWKLEVEALIFKYFINSWFSKNFFAGLLTASIT